MCLRKSEALRSHPTLPLDCSWVVLCIYSTWLFLSCIFYNKLTIVSEEFSCILYAILANIETCRGMGFGQYCCSVAKSCPTICDSMDCSMPASLSFTMSWSLLKFMSIESVMSSNHLILCHALFLLPSIFPSIRVFSNESVLHIRWPKYWSFSISPTNEYSVLISFRIDVFDVLAFQGIGGWGSNGNP